MVFQEIDIEYLEIGEVVREKLDVTNLKESIKEKGILSPLIVEEAPAARYRVISGKRRLEAARQLGLKKLPCIILTEVPKKDRLEINLIENFQREELLPLDEAKVFFRLNTEFGLSHKEIGTKIGTDRIYVTRSITLEKNLPEEYKSKIREVGIKDKIALLIVAREKDQELKKALFDAVLQGASAKKLRKIKEEKTRKRYIYNYRGKGYNILVNFRGKREVNKEELISVFRSLLEELERG